MVCYKPFHNTFKCILIIVIYSHLFTVIVKKREKNTIVPGNKLLMDLVAQNYGMQKYNVRLYASLTHVDDNGKAIMVDVGAKDPSNRIAHARGFIYVGPVISKLIQENSLRKGDALTIAQLAGIMAAKKTSELIPLCHPLMVNCVKVDLKLNDLSDKVEIETEVRCTGKTGVEMEALTAVSIAALTVYDMCKSAAPSDTMHISGIELVSKVGGSRGDFHRK